MNEILAFIPDSVFEILGLSVGFAACFVIAIQVVKEFRVPTASSMSMGYVSGWIGVYMFWALYGFRFEVMALAITNCIAVTLQTILFILVWRKRNRPAYY